MRTSMNNLDQMPVKRPVWRGDATSLAGKAYKAIEEKIVMLELAPGEIYTEKNLATRSSSGARRSAMRCFASNTSSLSKSSPGGAS